MSIYSREIRVPKQLGKEICEVADLQLKESDPVSKHQLLLQLKTRDGQKTLIQAPAKGRVRCSFVRNRSQVKENQLLLVIDELDISDFHVEESECNPDTEYGENARRGVERTGNLQYGKAVRQLVNPDSPQTGAVQGKNHLITAHPLLATAKQGASLKDSFHASTNSLSSEAVHRNELKLGHELAHRLQQTNASRNTITMSPL